MGNLELERTSYIGRILGGIFEESVFTFSPEEKEKFLIFVTYFPKLNILKKNFLLIFFN
jgi:hypothetical protein